MPALSCRAWTLAGALTALSSAAAAMPPWITFIDGGFTVYGISGDGSTVVGSRGSVAARWNRHSGIELLTNTYGWPTTKAAAASRDGSVIVGRTAILPNGSQLAFRWTSETGMRPLPDLPGGSEVGEAVGVSEDGTVVVGTGRSDHAYPVVWRAPNFGVESLGTVNQPNYTSGSATGISPDGSTVTMAAFQITAVVSQAAIWKADTGVMGLGDLPGGPDISVAMGSSRNGQTIVGFGRRYDQSHREEAFIWRAGDDALTGLGFLHPEPARSSAYAVSADGGVIVGEEGLSGAQFLDAFIWTPSDQMRGLASILSDNYGLDLGGRLLSRGQSISFDGRTIAGSARTASGSVLGFVAYMGSECVADFDDGSGRGQPDGGVTIDDLLYYLTLFAAGSIEGDIDDGSFTGTRDGGVTIDDLIFFLQHFAGGC